jgi:hypothetical protein
MVLPEGACEEGTVQPLLEQLTVPVKSSVTVNGAEPPLQVMVVVPPCFLAFKWFIEELSSEPPLKDTVLLALES